MKNKERYKDTSRKQYLFKQFYKFSSTIKNKDDPPTQETTEKMGLNIFRPQSLNKMSDYRRADKSKLSICVYEKALCFCSTNRKDKALLLFCALNSEEKRTSTSNKKFNLKGVKSLEYKETRTWEQLINVNSEVSIRGGH